VMAVLHKLYLLRNLESSHRPWKHYCCKNEIGEARKVMGVNRRNGRLRRTFLEPHAGQRIICLLCSDEMRVPLLVSMTMGK